jgi:hypothetical protein
LDFVGNNNGFVNGDFVAAEDGSYTARDLATYEWWRKVVQDEIALTQRLDVLHAAHGRAAIYAALEGTDACDLEDHAAVVNSALDKAFGQSKVETA